MKNNKKVNKKEDKVESLRAVFFMVVKGNKKAMNQFEKAIEVAGILENIEAKK